MFAQSIIRAIAQSLADGTIGAKAQLHPINLPLAAGHLRPPSAIALLLHR
jgi:hypothetical protein